MTVIQRLAMTTLLVCGRISAADAQQALSLEQMALLVNTGDTVTVTETSGRELKGRIGVLSPSSLTLLVSKGGVISLPGAEIQTVRQRRPDPLSNGTKWGFLSGAAFGATAAILAATENCYDCYPPAVFIPLAAAVYGGMGAVIGLGLDAMIVREHVIYARPAAQRRTVGVSPITAAGRRRGVLVSMRF
jgi:hypothetical protein